jgi:hypothetical protein
MPIFPISNLEFFTDYFYSVSSHAFRPGCCNYDKLNVNMARKLRLRNCTFRHIDPKNKD